MRNDEGRAAGSIEPPRKDKHPHIYGYMGALASVASLIVAIIALVIGEHKSEGQNISVTQKIQLGFSVMAPSLVNPPKLEPATPPASTPVVRTIPPPVPQQPPPEQPVPAPVEHQPDSPVTSSCVGLPSGLSAKSASISTFVRGDKVGYIAHIVLANETDQVAALIANRHGKLIDDAQNQLQSDEESLLQNGNFRFNPGAHGYLMTVGLKIDPHQAQVLTYTFNGATKAGASAALDTNLVYAFGPAPTVPSDTDSSIGQTALHCDLTVGSSKH